MKFLQDAFRNYHPLLQFIFIMCIALIGMTLAVFISTFANTCLCDTPLDPAQYHKVLVSATSKEGVCGNLVMNSINQILAFIGAGIVYNILSPGLGVGLSAFGALGNFMNQGKRAV